MVDDDRRRSYTGGTWRVPRSRGALSGLVLILLGIWGGLIPFVGPYFNYAYTPDTPWTYTTGRLVLEVLPAIATVIGGLLLMASANRVTATFGGWLASAAGAWFVVGPSLALLWSGNPTGAPLGGDFRRAIEQIGFFYGLGAAVLFFAALASGRLAVRSVRDLRAAETRRALAEREASDGVVDDGAVGGDRLVRDERVVRDGRVVREDRTTADGSRTIDLRGDEAATGRGAHAATPEETSTPGDTRTTTERRTP